MFLSKYFKGCANKILFLLSKFQVAEDDGLPSSVCHQCIENIYSCYNFIKACKSTDSSLRYCIKEKKLLENDIKQDTKGIKEEIDLVPIKEEDFFDGEDIDNAADDFNFDIDLAKRDSDSDNMFIAPKKKKKVKTLIKLKDKLRLKKKSKHKRLLKELSRKPFNLKELSEKQLKKEYSCPVCQGVIIGKRELNLHLAEQHEDYRKYVCTHCKKGKQTMLFSFTKYQ